MTMSDIGIEQSHTYNLPYEIHNGHVEQTKQEQPKRTEVESQQTVPFDNGQGSIMELLTHRFRYIVRSAELLADFLHQTLELRCGSLLLLGIVDVSLLEITLHGWCFIRHLVVNLLLTLRVIQLGPLLTFQEEEVNLNVIVSQTLLSTRSHDTANKTQSISYTCSYQHILWGVVNTQPLELQVVMQIEAIHQSTKEQLDAMRDQMNVFMASQAPDMVKALEQYEEQLAELDEQIEDAEEEYNIVNPFYGLGGARIDDLEYEQKKKGQAQNIAELKQKRKAIKKQIDMINSFLRKK